MLRMKKIIVAVIAVGAALIAGAKEKVVFDTDIGGDVDDALALAYFAKSPDCELMGVTIEAWGGNGPRQAEIASAICREYGRGKVPIAIGPGFGHLLGARWDRKPKANPRYWPIVEKYPHETFAPRNDAVEFLRRTINEHPGEIVIVATGHYTNLGVLFQLDPDIPAKLKRLVLMGARYDSSEWNVCQDPIATGMVFGNADNLRPPETWIVIGNTTFPYHFKQDKARAFFAEKPSMKICAEAAEYWLENGKRDLYFHDPIAAVIALKPELAEWKTGTVTVSLEKGKSGFVHLDEKPEWRHAPLKITTKIDFNGFLAEFQKVF